MDRIVRIITTGGTIEKTYDERDGSLANRESFIEKIIFENLRLPRTKVLVFPILWKDSLLFEEDDRNLIVDTIKAQEKYGDPMIVLHGTDTLSLTATYCSQRCLDPMIPIIFTGAMRPLGFIKSDALQNITESILASSILPSGFYVCFHGQVIEATRAVKNKKTLTFDRIIPKGMNCDFLNL
tara:strand:+ start:134 stop:679 length:546 start_codon:yes stop_codon:yes gene_type:complete